MRFTKMEGCGNDYIYIDCFVQGTPEDPGALARRLSNRHFGIGSDGLILICRSELADCRMEMYNADGSRAEMCGNGVRCVGKYIYDHRISQQETITVETGAGIKTLELSIDGGVCTGATVDMGAPVLTPELIPTTLTSDTPGDPVLRTPLELPDGQTVEVSCVSMGNPHAVIFVEDADTYDVTGIGRMVETHPAFPARINVHFLSPAPGGFRIRSWERGAGETLACGTGACASLVAATLCGMCNGSADLRTSGGVLHIEWRRGDSVFMTGPATEVYSGDISV